MAMYRRRFQTWNALLVSSYGAVAALEVMQWLGGGVEAPYERAILLPVLFVGAIQPPRRIAGFLCFLAVAFMVPFLYDGWHSQAAGASLASLVVLAGVSIGVNVPMSAIRAQRLAHARQEAEAREEARIDCLTGLHNRRAFDEALGDEVKLARRLGIPLTVAMVDVVSFKEINDRWSPAEGDRCLREVAKALGSSLRDPDEVFRWGGDEFALILTGTVADATDLLRDRLDVIVASSCSRPDQQPLELRFAAAQLQEPPGCRGPGGDGGPCHDGYEDGAQPLAEPRFGDEGRRTWRDAWLPGAARRALSPEQAPRGKGPRGRPSCCGRSAWLRRALGRRG